MTILVATKERLVLDTLLSSEDTELVTALDTGRIYEAISGTHLAIVDRHELVEEPYSADLIVDLLANAGITCCTSEEFIADTDHYLDARSPSSRTLELPPKRTIAFTSYSGGTGKTSLALDTVLHFVNQTARNLRLPAAIFECVYGDSALEALLGGEQVPLSLLLQQPELDPFKFRDVALYPMDYTNTRQIPNDQYRRYCREQMANNVLTVIDTMWPHGHALALGDDVDMWVVMTTPRIDAIENARKLQNDLRERYGEEKVLLVVNQMGGFASKLALMGLERDIMLPRMQHADTFFDGRLGKEILSRVYGPLWQQYEKRRRGLFRKRR